MTCRQNLISQQQEHLSLLNKLGGSELDSPDADVNLEEGMPKILKRESLASESCDQFFTPQTSSPTGAYGEHLSRCVRIVCSCLNERLDDFVQLLVTPLPSSPISTTVGILQQPLGLIRLEVIHLFVALFATSDLSILSKCADTHVLNILTVSLKACFKMVRFITFDSQ